MQEHIFTPLGMRHTTSLPREVDPLLLAAPHRWATEGATKIEDFPYAREDGPAGGMCSNVEDMLRYAQAHLNRGSLDGVEILPAAAYDEMWLAAQPTGGRTPLNGEEKYGLGWFVGDVGGHLIVGHGGLPDGYEAGFWLAPNDGAAVVTLANRTTWANDVMNLGWDVLGWMLGVER